MTPGGLERNRPIETSFTSPGVSIRDEFGPRAKVENSRRFEEYYEEDYSQFSTAPKLLPLAMKGTRTWPGR
jgi:hypothetical protein